MFRLIPADMIIEIPVEITLVEHENHENYILLTLTVISESDYFFDPNTKRLLNVTLVNDFRYIPRLTLYERRMLYGRRVITKNLFEYKLIGIATISDFKQLMKNYTGKPIEYNHNHR